MVSLSSNADRPRVLVVEDEALVALDLRRRLLSAGYDVTATVDTGDQALAEARRAPPSLVLMDISLRGALDGVATAERIVAAHDAPVVFLTAYGDDITLERAAAVSPYGYLLKPFDDRSLLSTVRVALERHAADTRQRLLTAAVEAASVGILLAECRGNARPIVYCNRTFSEMTGHPPAAILGQQACVLALDPSTEDAQRLLAAVREGVAANGVVEARGAEGVPFWSSVSVSPVTGSGEKPTHILIFHTDVSQRRATEAALLESQRLELVGRLTAGIAHDFNNVLGAILAFSELVRDDLPSDAPARDDLAEVLHAARRGASLTRKLLDFSRKGDDGTGEACELVKVISDARGILERVAGPKLVVELDLAPEPLFVRSSATAIEQVLLNLAANARDAMPGGGTLTLSASRPWMHAPPFGARRYVRLEVRDDGPGMPPQVADRVFEPFFTTKRRGTGTGLGLVSVRMVAERAGGRARLSTAPGEGACFTLDLPFVDQPQLRETGELTLDDRRVDAGGASVLIVEDEPALRSAAARAMTRSGFAVRAVGTGEDAIAAIDADPHGFDLVVCDMVLPGVNGAAVLRHVHAVSPLTAKMVMTGFFEHTADLPEVGTPVLWKPFSPATLTQRALEHLARRDAARPAASGTLPMLPSRGASSATPPALGRPDAGPSRADRGRVLVFDDDVSLRRVLVRTLRDHAYQVIEALTPDEVRVALAQRDLELAVIGVDDAGRIGRAAARAALDHPNPLPVVLMGGPRDAGDLTTRAAAVLAKPLHPGAFAEQVEATLTAGLVARMHRDLMMTQLEVDAPSVDGEDTRRRFEAALPALSIRFVPLLRAADGALYGHAAVPTCPDPGFVDDGALRATAFALGQCELLGRRVGRAVADALAAQPPSTTPVFVRLTPGALRADLLLDPADPLLPYARRVVLEVTKHAGFQQNALQLAGLPRLRAAGYRLALAGLGDGHSGLAWLTTLDPDVAKLDPALVRGIDAAPLRQRLVATLARVCGRSGVHLVAEGVHSPAEGRALARLGCALLQPAYDHAGRSAALAGGPA